MALLTNRFFLSAVFGLFMGYTAFIMVLLWSALFNNWVITIDFNYFGEGWLEFVLFGLLAPIFVMIFIVSYAKFIVSYAKALRKIRR